jgi:hypothetical protein
LAGEVSILVQDSKLRDNTTMVFHENQEENKLWFCKILPDKKKKVFRCCLIQGYANQ